MCTNNKIAGNKGNRMNKEESIFIDDIDVSQCCDLNKEDPGDYSYCGRICEGTECKYKRLWYKKKLAEKEREVIKISEKDKQLIYSISNQVV